MRDLIVEEIRQYRDEYTKQLNHDFYAISEDLRKKQSESGQRFISRHSQKFPLKPASVGRSTK